MKSRERSNAPTHQLEAEVEWLISGAGWASPDLARQTEEFLRHPDLAPILKIVEQHNSQPREVPGKQLPQKDNFLLGPHLLQVLMSVEGRSGMRQRYPVLDQPAANVRNDLQKIVADCNALAELVRKAPQPLIALAAESNANEVLKVLYRPTELFEATDGSERQIVLFSDLIRRAASWFEDDLHVPRARQNRRPSATAAKAQKAEFRDRAVEWISSKFQERLGHPYDAHVATIAAVMSGLETTEDFVKKVRRRRAKASNSGGQNPSKDERNCPVC
jgi:hypothetical protein